VEYVLPPLEIIDSRIRDWKVSLSDTIAEKRLVGRGGARLHIVVGELQDLAVAGLGSPVSHGEPRGDGLDGTETPPGWWRTIAAKRGRIKV
jgi:hypothetical protein